MPTGNNHYYLCKDLEIACQSKKGRCPLDETNWHSRHWNVLNDEWTKIAGNDGPGQGVGRYVQNVLHEMERYFEEFKVEFRDSQNSPILKKCWDAHLIADAVANYKWEEIRQEVKKQYSDRRSSLG